MHLNRDKVNAALEMSEKKKSPEKIADTLDLTVRMVKIILGLNWKYTPDATGALGTGGLGAGDRPEGF